MSEEIVPQVFESSEFGKLRVTQDENGEPWFVASDIAKALGYRDAEKMTRRLDDDEKDTRSVGTPGGEQQMTVITEAGMYSAILGSKVEGAKRFKRWVTHEVLPAIRRDGGYMAARDETPEETMARTVLIANSTIERQKASIAELEAKVAEQAPKAGLFDSCMDGERWSSVTEVSRLLHQYDRSITRTRLFDLMTRDGIITRDRQASKEGIDRGYVVNYQPPACFNQKTGEAIRPKPYAKVTSKGLAWMLRRYCKEEAVA